MSAVTNSPNSPALPGKTGDPARQWARRAVLGIVHESGGRTVARPVFRDRPDLDLTVPDADSMIGLEAAAKLKFAARQLTFACGRQAREDGPSSQEVGYGVGFRAVADSGVSGARR